jgi:hypothetical protein
MKLHTAITILCIFPLLLIISCSKSSTEVPLSNGKMAPLSIEFDNIAGGANLRLNSESYKTAAGDTFSVDLLQYFISNIKLLTTGGHEYIVPQDSSYFLIKESEAEARFARLQVPEGDYTSLTFTLGVDSLRSTMDVSKRKGVLDPAGGMENGMYWGWNSGYIFFKMEGLSPQAPSDPTGQHKFRYHIGGFGGYSAPTINNIKTITLGLNAGGTAKVREGRKCNIHLLVDILKALNGSTNINIASNSAVMFSQFSVNIANNYVNMFSHDHTEN